MSFMSTCQTRRDKNSRAFRITHKVPMKIDFQFTLDHETDMPFFAPVRFYELGCKLDQAKLLCTATKSLEFRAMNSTPPLQRVEQNPILFHFTCQVLPAAAW